MRGPVNSRRWKWLGAIAVIVAAGILSRMIHTGYVLLDKYLGGALYAAMIYGMLRLVLNAPASAAAWAMIVMAAIECFQLTLIPARLLASEHWLWRICARLMGVTFSVADLAAYAVGIAAIFLVDSTRTDRNE